MSRGKEGLGEAESAGFEKDRRRARGRIGKGATVVERDFTLLFHLHAEKARKNAHLQNAPVLCMLVPISVIGPFPPDWGRGLHCFTECDPPHLFEKRAGCVLRRLHIGRTLRLFGPGGRTR